MSLGREVPEELWMAVAEILVWAYGLEKRAITPNR
jgi:type III secretion system FlhB-like substrate exporter